MDALPELAAFLESLPEPHILFDRDYRILAANSAYRLAFSPNDEVVGRRCYEVSHHFDRPCDQAGESCPLAQSLRSGGRERVLHLHHTPKGEEYVNIELTPLPDAQGRLHGFVEKVATLPSVRPRGDEGAALVGRSPAFQRMLARVARVASAKASVLLLGESGTGKELVARAIHEGSPRASRPLVVVDCSSLPETLFESEVFGHEKGAFTGATHTKIGLVEAANGGTLFLDEVGDIPPPMQVKLLRLLESGTYRRVGSTELRLTLHPQALQRLMAHPFPGNVGELRNVLEHAALWCDGDEILPEHVEEALAAGRRAAPASAAATVAPPAGSDGLEAEAPDEAPLPTARRERERETLRRALQAHHGSRAALAARLGISERTLYRKLKAHGLLGEAPGPAAAASP
ncbi:sigma 54-interacting transcriptional regulator [Tepidimonas aquatica]|uniref:Transcriptional regulatory protein ZraR n=1 Tax=Tepidimonas aquatica TaxID=247482 RepID=A0A554WQC6_9BURK|nr:sigma 54-interacting transcriptional regulator [Tepidimonas aquatica]TSE25776.1 Transcriptional regulatory protein ZraR [Tepidimonas aquatica]